MNVNSRISLPRLRQQAVERLKQERPGMVLSSEVELATLNLLEAELCKDPAQAVLSGPRRKFHHESRDGCTAPLSPARDLRPPGGEARNHYEKSLASSMADLGGLGTPGVLAPAVRQVLDGIQWEVLNERAAGFRTLGRLDDVATANKATGPRETLEWDVVLTGHWSEEQAGNVRSAVRELARVTGTKALNLLREVHLQTDLGSLGEDTPILGLTRAPGPVGLRREAANHGPTTRWLLFHEVGHQLDRYLSGSSRQFRSHQADSPFGKSDNPDDYVDGQQVGSPHEDFADCHACALYHYDQVKANPDLHIHSRGKMGEKMAWVLEQGYGERVPPPGETYKAALQQVDSGHSPFSNRAHFHREVNRYLDSPSLVPPSSRDWLRLQLNSKESHPG